MSQLLVPPEIEQVDELELWEMIAWLENQHIIYLSKAGETEPFTQIVATNEQWLKINEVMSFWGMTLDEVIVSAILTGLGEDMDQYDTMLCMAIHGMVTRTYWYTGEYLVG